MATKKKHIHYHKDGTIWAKGFLAGTKMEGFWEWFRKDGTIMRSGNFKADKQVGKWTTYDKKGRIVKVTEMKPKQTLPFKDGAKGKVIGGIHKGKSGIVIDIKKSKTGHVTVTVVQSNGVRFKTLGKNISV